MKHAPSAASGAREAGAALVSTGEGVRFRRAAHVAGLELATARYRRRAFPRHLHDEFVIGAMTMGAEKLTIRGRDRIVRQGSLILIEPGEPHANAGGDDNPFGYVVFYVPPSVMSNFTSDEFDGDARTCVRFQDSVPHAPDVCLVLRQAHELLAAGETPLAEESAVAGLLSALLQGGHLVEARLPVGVVREAVKHARDYIEEHFREPISLRQLSDLTGASTFHLLRSFKQEVGLPPAAYQIHLKVAEAKRLLRSGGSIADAAAELGFVDQSHLNRHFCKIVGTTPGRYAAQ